jgi:hypothetical protein
MEFYLVVLGICLLAAFVGTALENFCHKIENK